MKKALFLIFTAILAVIAGCSSQPTPAQLEGITLNKKSITLEVGETQKLRVRYNPEDAADTAPAVVWQSDKTKIADVSDNGEVVAKKVGTAVITATCGKFSAECKVEVVKATEDPENTEDKYLKLEVYSIETSSAGGKQTLLVESSSTWSVTNYANWITVTPDSGEDNETVTVTIDPTSEKGDKTATITFKNSTSKAELKVTRKGYETPCFSVSETKRVTFAPGNLQYQASTKTWRFAEHQYDMIGEDNKNISSTYSDWIDLFGWGTGNNPTNTTSENKDYPTFTDWGVNKISNGGNTANQWYTLTSDELKYMIYTRTDASKLRGLATVNSVKGFVLLPDSWSLPSGLSFTATNEKWTTNDYSVTDWQQMEKAGAVFLPAAGTRYVNTIQSAGSYGAYWSSTPDESKESYAYDLHFSVNSYTFVSSLYTSRCYGRAVRLVKDVE